MAVACIFLGECLLGASLYSKLSQSFLPSFRAFLNILLFQRSYSCQYFFLVVFKFVCSFLCFEASSCDIAHADLEITT